ncbi:MAG: UDP-3-O-(3-hydroxymyristoyl)glucosamine N-acyltransferase [Gammaproteobacteria bacterium]|nr:UDP-3-O-(3-hydroxymyristoyl)glucosamine N-acyltransferase [Gammaproteobacteria bacterium]MDH4252937.1 UDP-3-O-(3-hydroxymyristoyl)glucosamine N-acyltransferase [Gammaproteobacteria bacterium]MDH5308377.1 UDP-3-O-(3-hydroxymyristoyl)glucosamine N-acyltransferase [Gammaproteobacteria bacterium]
MSGSFVLRISLGELATRFGCELVGGEPDTPVERVATLVDAGPGTISFYTNSAYRKVLGDTRASAVILSARDAKDCPVAALISRDAYAVFARIAALLHPAPPHRPGIHPGAVIDESVSVPPSAYVGPLAIISAGAVIGENAYIGPNCVVGERCTVGPDSKLVASVTLVEDVQIGKRCIIHPGAVIGGDGFGNAMTPDGWLKVPQLGGVRIGDDVEIGCNTTVDRGAIGDTVICNGVRLDNLIQIAHNVRLGEHTAIAAMVAIAGSTEIGARCMMAGKVGVAGHIRMCDDVIVMGNSMITKDVTEPGLYSGTFAAEKDRDWKRQVARFKRLEELARRVAQLEKAGEIDE